MLGPIIEGSRSGPRYPGFEHAFAEWFRNHFYQNATFRKQFAEKLQVAYSELKEIADFVTVVEWPLPGRRPDLLVITRNLFIVIEFKDGAVWKDIRGAYTKQLRKYVEQLEELDWYQQKKRLIGVLVVSYPPDSVELETDREYSILDDSEQDC
jgi:hypothetical protein